MAGKELEIFVGFLLGAGITGFLVWRWAKRVVRIAYPPEPELKLDPWQDEDQKFLEDIKYRKTRAKEYLGPWKVMKMYEYNGGLSVDVKPQDLWTLSLSFSGLTMDISPQQLEEKITEALKKEYLRSWEEIEQKEKEFLEFKKCQWGSIQGEIHHVTNQELALAVLENKPGARRALREQL